MVYQVARPETLASAAVECRTDGQGARQSAPGTMGGGPLPARGTVTEVLLIRHGHQTLDLAGPIGGFDDPPLSSLGVRQAELLAAALSTRKLDAVFSSPLQRAWATATAIARHHRLEPFAMDDLREVAMFRDAPQHQTSLEFMGEQAMEILRQRFISERRWDVYPHSESSAEFRGRVIRAIEAIIGEHADGRLAVVCHGGVINAYVSHVVGSRYDVLFRPAHTSISVVASADGVQTLCTLNDVHHLSTVDGDVCSA